MSSLRKRREEAEERAGGGACAGLWLEPLSLFISDARPDIRHLLFFCPLFGANIQRGCCQSLAPGRPPLSKLPPQLLLLHPGVLLFLLSV